MRVTIIDGDHPQFSTIPYIILILTCPPRWGRWKQKSCCLIHSLPCPLVLTMIYNLPLQNSMANKLSTMQPQQQPTLTLPPTFPTSNHWVATLVPTTCTNLDALLASIWSMVTMPGPLLLCLNDDDDAMTINTHDVTTTAIQPCKPHLSNLVPPSCFDLKVHTARLHQQYTEYTPGTNNTMTMASPPHSLKDIHIFLPTWIPPTTNPSPQLPATLPSHPFHLPQPLDKPHTPWHMVSWNFHQPDMHPTMHTHHQRHPWQSQLWT